MSKSLTKAWAEFVTQLTLKPEKIIAGVQRIHTNQEWVLPGEVFLDPNSMSLKETGYTKSKISMLSRHYNPQNVERAVSDLLWRIKNKKYGSGVIYFQGEKKKNTKQDWCMTALVVSYYPQAKHTQVTMFYRTAESIKRFRGDLVYLREVVLPMFKDVFKQAPMAKITMNFANVTLHPMYWLLLIQHQPQWRMALEGIRKTNPKLFRNICYWCWRYLLDKSKSIDSYSSAKQVRVIAERCTDKDVLEEFKAWLYKVLMKDWRLYPDSVKAWRKKKL